MADNIQDTEMEDILSSIKNILEEDEQQHSAATTDNKDVDIVSDVVNAPSDDILELSPDMRLQDTENTTAPLSEPEATDEVDAVINDQSDSSLSLDIEDSNPLDLSIMPDDNSLSFAAPSEANSDMPQEIGSLNIGFDDIDSDSFFEDMQKDDTPLSIETSADTSNDISSISLPQIDELENEVSLNTDREVADIISESETPQLPQEDVSLPPVSMVEEPLQVEEVLPSEEVHQVEETPQFEETPQVEEAQQFEEIPQVEEASQIKEPEALQDTAVDASANIISNFAKMFSHTSTEPVKENIVTDEVRIKSVGEPSKTLEEFVQDSITKVIGNEISKKWNDGADFETFAKEEIIRQTQAWINNNLPNLVEKVVKQEIERVIAKVGS